MPRIAGLLLTCSFLFLCLYCTGTYCSFFSRNQNDCKSAEWFKCDNGQCIPFTFECDEDMDCLDGSDEKNCSGFRFQNPINVQCTTEEFRCANSDCIPKEKYCDLMNDCTDGSDEYANCTTVVNCDDSMFRCNEGHCVRKSWVCDDTRDCPDGSDEINCYKTVTPSKCTIENQMFLCPNEQCISLLRTCDGSEDCADGKDEHGSCSIHCTIQGCDRCKPTPMGPVCFCSPGYKLVNNHTTCIDIDECEIYGICDQHCVNNVGSYACRCEKNYVLQEDGRTCKAEGGEASLVFSSTMEIRGIHLDSRLYFTVVQNVNKSVYVAIDGDFVYWSQDATNGDAVIVKMELSGNKKENFINAGMKEVTGLAIDWITGNVYFADGTNKYIGVCSNESLCAIINNETDARGIAILPNTGMMYWCAWGDKMYIVQAEMDGQHMSHLVTDNLDWPINPTIDYPNDRLYWVASRQKKVESIRLDGTDRRVILENFVIHPFSISVFENKLYWSDWESDTIHYCDKFSSKKWTTLLRTSGKPQIIHIDHSALKPKFRNPCQSNPCSDLCLLKHNAGYTCVCAMNRKLSADKHTCQEKEYVLIFTANTIVDYYHGMIGKPKIHFPEERHWHHELHRITYDPLTDTVFQFNVFSDELVTYNFTNRFHPIKTNIREPLMKFDNQNPFSLNIVTRIGYDYIGQNMYVSYLRKMQDIMVMNMKTFNKTYLKFDKRPVDFLLIPEKGMMFVVFENATYYYIDRLRMDGTSPDEPSVRSQFNNRTRSEKQLLGGVSLCLCYDNDREAVFFADTYTGYVWFFSIKDLSIHDYYNGLKEPVNIISDGKYFYWSEDESTILHSMYKDDPPKKSQIDLHTFGVFNDITHIISLRNVTLDGEYGCRDNNGNCSHVCLTTSATSFVCTCPALLVLAADNRSCVPFKCPENTFRCDNELEICIERKKWCDGHKDCPNWQDEPGRCKPMSPCEKRHQFMCDNGSCIDIAGRCNSHFDCADQSDENGCFEWKKCADDEYSCSNGKCINFLLVCNGLFDCTDYSDEINCKNHTCLSDHFMCKETRQCIPMDWHCDGETDCADGSDEEECKQVKCDSEYFMCRNGLCISSSMRCNDVDECGDKSDEEECNWHGRKSQSDHCKDDEYGCANTNMCIPKEKRCNGIQDCIKNDDEHHCAACHEDEFRCENMRCILKTWMCDGINDCGDNSDETECNHYKSQLDINFNTSIKCDEFQCASNGMCLSYDHVCNYRAECPDGSDENGECVVACRKEMKNVCKGRCISTPQGGVCGCNPGYRLDIDGISCIDVNECEINSSCSQLCENTIGSYKCSCFVGFVTRNDGISCKGVGSPMKIFTAVGKNIKMITFNLRVVTIIPELLNVEVTGIDVNAIDNFLYWSNGELGTIIKQNMKTGNISKLTGTSYPTKLAVDWITDNVFFIDKFYPNSIKVCNFEKMKCATVIQREDHMQMTSILVDPLNRLLYWSEVDRKTYQNGQIFRAYMKGSYAHAIVSENIGKVEGMAIDYMKFKLYWMDSVNKIVESSNLDGTERSKFLRTDEDPLNIGIFENMLFLADKRGWIKKCPLYGKESCKRFDLGHSNIHKNFAIMHISKNPYTKNFCENAICDHICVPDINKAVCMCEDGRLVEPYDICNVTKNKNDQETLVSSVDAKSRNVQYRPGGYSAVIITLLLALLILFGLGYCYYQKNKGKSSTNPEFVSIRFQNPAYDRADEVAVMLDQPNSNLAPGEHEYTNPIDDVVIKAAEDCSIEKLRRIPEQLETEEKQTTLISLTKVS